MDNNTERERIEVAVVIDADGPTDATAKVEAALAALNPRVRFADSMVDEDEPDPMTTFAFNVYVTTDTQENADLVMGERIDVEDPDSSFSYQIEWERVKP